MKDKKVESIFFETAFASTRHEELSIVAHSACDGRQAEPSAACAAVTSLRASGSFPLCSFAFRRPLPSFPRRGSTTAVGLRSRLVSAHGRPQWPMKALPNVLALSRPESWA